MKWTPPNKPGGKGDSRRPEAEPEKTKENWNQIFGEKPKKEPYVPPPLPQ